MGKIIPRWEWRTFGENFGEPQKKIEEHEIVRVKESKEVYILSTESNDNTKIRDDLMDIKTLQQVNEDKLEQWMPIMKGEFPLPDTEIKKVFDAFKVDLPDLKREEYTYEQFLEELINPHEKLKAVDVEKKRFGYTINDCIVEVAEVKVDGKPTRTIAVELENPKKVIKKVPVIGVGRINDPQLAEQILQENKADIVALGRQSICDPYFVKKVKEKREKDILKCIACNNCINSLALQKEINCSINPNILESDEEIEKTKNPKKVLIVGAGPAGLTAAKYAKLKGHEVVIIDKNNKIGGTLNLANKAPYKNEINNIMNYYNYKIKDLNIDLRLNTVLTPKIVDDIQPDILIIATGSKPLIPKINGLE